MERYQKVEKAKGETPINENELRITSQGGIRNYISYALSLLQEKGSKEIVLKATGRAINKTVMIAELIKRRIVGLHQNTTTGSVDITDMWEPLEEGLLPIETTRHVSIITITLSKQELDSSSIGYQPPIPADQVKPKAEFDDGEAPFGIRTKGHGGQGRNGENDNGTAEYSNEDRDNGHRYEGGQGRGRGRGRNFHGRGRGGLYGNSFQPDSRYDNGYGGSRPLPAQGRGRGHGRGGFHVNGRGRVGFVSDGIVKTVL